MLNARNVVIGNPTILLECKCIIECSKDSASNPEPIVIAKEKQQWSRSHSGSPSWKHPNIEIQHDIDTYVFKTFDKFKSAMDICEAVLCRQFAILCHGS